MNHDIGIKYASRQLVLGFSLALLLISARSSFAADPPPALSPNEGYPGAIIQITGAVATGLTAILDSESSAKPLSVVAIAKGLFFSIPPDAAPGAHTVRLQRNGTPLGAAMNFTILQGQRHKPRLDGITVSSFSIDARGHASTNLMAHGANIDVGAKILINGEERQTFFYQVLKIPSPSSTPIAPDTLGYPIQHYATVYTPIDDAVPGTTLDIAIRNLDGKISNVIKYQLARNMDELDSDGDGLPDVWETKGVDSNHDGTIDVDLRPFGANPLRKDIFIEVDWMDGFAPDPSIWSAIVDAFASAPVLNSDGTQGIAIHIDYGQGGPNIGGGTVIPAVPTIGFGPDNPHPGADYVDFHNLKRNPANFDPRRLTIFRYCIFANDNAIQSGSSGQAEDIWCNDFFVSLGTWGDAGRVNTIQIGTFMHELGHTLNLRHGGFEDTNRKPNYNSIMQYGKYCHPGDPFEGSPAQVSGIDVNCSLCQRSQVYTYSEGTRRDLNENDLDERIGLCNKVQKDWNQNRVFEGHVAYNLDDDPALTIIRDHADWANIQLNFLDPCSRWGGD